MAALGREARQQAVVCPSRPDAHTKVRTRSRGTADRSLGGYSSGDSARHKSSVLWLPRSQLRSGAQGRHHLAQSPPLRRTSGWLWLWRGPDAAASARKGRPSGTASIGSVEGGAIRRGPLPGSPGQFCCKLREDAREIRMASFLHRVSFLAFPRVGFVVFLQIRRLSTRHHRECDVPNGRRPRAAPERKRLAHGARCRRQGLRSCRDRQGRSCPSPQGHLFVPSALRPLPAGRRSCPHSLLL